MKEYTGLEQQIESKIRTTNPFKLVKTIMARKMVQDDERVALAKGEVKPPAHVILGQNLYRLRASVSFT